MRPRFGLMRGKEFLMKGASSVYVTYELYNLSSSHFEVLIAEADMYSFDANESAALESYNAVKAAYERIFTSLALPTSVRSSILCVFFFMKNTFCTYGNVGNQSE